MSVMNNPDVNLAICTLIFMVKHQFKSRFPYSFEFNQIHSPVFLIQNLCRSSSSDQHKSYSKYSSLPPEKCSYFFEVPKYFPEFYSTSMLVGNWIQKIKNQILFPRVGPVNLTRPTWTHARARHPFSPISVVPLPLRASPTSI
jgi:hypothetical protein